ncbi:AAA family ATPase [Melaminivora jejuensis]|uniref:AAA family ATPase n=1 Tax=Melaminivora jejuensis TaxID=1267217 RepID=UPI001AE06E27|nr:AAA family ATPase [Melaminivora jejuensis]UHJ65223.1 ATP-binding protein [Melaminivora jejuensis]
MLKKANIQNFGPLPNGTYQFSPSLNVVVGENGLGKSQLLKLLYAVLKVNADARELTKAELQKAYAEKLVGVFRPDALGRLAKRKQGRERCEVQLHMHEAALSCAFSFASQAKSEVQLDKAPTQALEQAPAYIPTRELVTLCPWFGPLYDNFHLRFEESWRDTVSLLGAPSVKGPREKKAAALLAPLEEAMGGKVVVDSGTGEFYLSIPGEGSMEMPLVAEGLRKLAMLARLISTGVLLDKGYLLWDEPETNLNPKLIKVIARSILALCQQGIQVFIATHSLFLMRELEILLQEPALHAVQPRYFALKAGETGTATALEQSADLYDIQTLVLLDEELHQSDRFLAAEGLHARD